MAQREHRGDPAELVCVCTYACVYMCAHVCAYVHASLPRESLVGMLCPWQDHCTCVDEGGEWWRRGWREIREVSASAETLNPDTGEQWRLPVRQGAERPTPPAGDSWRVNDGQGGGARCLSCPGRRLCPGRCPPSLLACRPSRPLRQAEAIQRWRSQQKSSRDSEHLFNPNDLGEWSIKSSFLSCCKPGGADGAGVGTGGWERTG